ncbi:aldo/keto reductase [Lacticaseibacillus saniviri]|uniref:Methylglyoxal reductase n=1 Tax=Lacticaseibacillus saniviri JCM 17471 = DSM 24301 TaxID=1293598 RepID=A0A0R2MNB0_9LACO|nr:aldo/keto reductase [Lacticaseibacillus saniviri]KRO15174.1 methylglyoxal reductase [Lacticaseibacillus saniviri JCM 17471 = DSM 24301]MCG4281133.1 aldo/keto reductase [Lacticaseibacillus saniviri]
MNEQEMVTLNNGVLMPATGFGVFQVAPADTKALVISALHSGYRMIDTAQLYQNEAQVGQAIQASGIDRQDVFVTTKLWIDHTGYDKTVAAVNHSLTTMGLAYIDLFLLHQPYGDIFGSWQALADLQRQGKIRAIGVSNFAPDQLVNLVANTAVVPQVNQIEVNPWHQNIEGDTWNQKYQVQTEAFASFAEGKNAIFAQPALMAIAAKYGKTTGQVILRWLYQRHIVSLAKTSQPKRMTENLAIFDFELDQDDMAMILALDTKQSVFADARNPQVVEMLNKVKLPLGNE